MGSQLKIEIAIPLIPLQKEEVHLLEYTNNAISELLGLSGKLEVTLESVQKCKISISILEDYKSLASRLKTTSTALLFEICVPDNSSSISIEIKEHDLITSSDKKVIYGSMVADQFRHSIYRFLILTQIAKPGTLKLREGDILVDNKLDHFFYPFNSLHRLTLDQNKKFKWPSYVEIKFIDAWNWYLQNSFSIQGQGKSKAERAINAFTYLFKDYLGNTESDLFWSLIGIEALYCMGTEGLSEQIYIKSQIVLGEITDYKKRLKQMYDFRSRLVHGDLDIPPKHFDSEDVEYNNFHQKLIDSAILAVAILTATLQRMIIDNKKELEFKYTLQ